MNIKSDKGTRQAHHSADTLNHSIRQILWAHATKAIRPGLLILLMLKLATTAQAQFGYADNGDGTCTITNYTGFGNGPTFVPTNINGLTVTSIGPGAFANSVSLNSVTIPASVTNIGAYAFENCSALTNVVLPNTLPRIQRLMFAFCTSLPSVTIPNGVTSLDDDVFESCYNLTNITIAGSVTNIGNNAFSTQTVTTAYFEGNAPFADSTGLNTTASVPVAYYLPGTTGWSAFSANTGVPVVLWNPQIQTSDGGFGIQNGQFGFNITGTNRFTVVVEACTNLTNPVWTPLQTNTLVNGSYYFTDPEWVNYNSRFYQLIMP